MRLVIDFTRGRAHGFTATGEHDDPLVHQALAAGAAREHQLVEHIAKLEAALNNQNELLRTRTIELDHVREDAHLWSLCLAYIVKEDEIGSVPADEVNAMEGQMLSAEVSNGRVWLSLQDRPAPSDEGLAG